VGPNEVGWSAHEKNNAWAIALDVLSIKGRSDAFVRGMLVYVGGKWWFCCGGGVAFVRKLGGREYSGAATAPRFGGQPPSPRHSECRSVMKAQRGESSGVSEPRGFRYFLRNAMMGSAMIPVPFPGPKYLL